MCKCRQDMLELPEQSSILKGILFVEQLKSWV